MSKAMRGKNVIHLRQDFSGDSLRKLEAIKKHYGLSAYAEAIRVLIAREYERIAPLLPPRLTHYNLYEDHVSITDNEVGRIIDVYKKGNRLLCSYDESDSCMHVDFARNVIREKKATD